MHSTLGDSVFSRLTLYPFFSINALLFDPCCRYVGDFEAGKRHGRGKFSFASGNEYEGEYKQDDMHGVGVYKYSGGNEYRGEWRDNQAHGKGAFTSSQGDTYEGQYRTGKMHGAGTYTYSSGDVFEGEFEDDEEHGKGKCTFHNGDICKCVLRAPFYRLATVPSLVDNKSSVSYRSIPFPDEGEWVRGKRHGESMAIDTRC